MLHGSSVLLCLCLAVPGLLRLQSGVGSCCCEVLLQMPCLAELCMQPLQLSVHFIHLLVTQKLLCWARPPMETMLGRLWSQVTGSHSTTDEVVHVFRLAEARVLQAHPTSPCFAQQPSLRCLKTQPIPLFRLRPACCIKSSLHMQHQLNNMMVLLISMPAIYRQLRGTNVGIGGIVLVVVGKMLE